MYKPRRQQGHLLLLVDSFFVDELKVGARAKWSVDLERGVALDWVWKSYTANGQAY